MGLGLALVICFLIFVLFGVVIFQAQFAAKKWRKVIQEGDQSALHQLIANTIEDWQRKRAPRDQLLAEWNAQQSIALVAAENHVIRVSLLAEPAMTVMNGLHQELQSVERVGYSAMIRTIERIMYEVPHVSFTDVQVDVYTEYRAADGTRNLVCLMVCRTDRDTVAHSDWESGNLDVIAEHWDITHASQSKALDPEEKAILSSAGQ